MSHLKNCESFCLFSCNILKFVNTLRLGLSHFRQNEFKHSFQDTFNPLWNCDTDVQSCIHTLHHCPFFLNERCTLMSNLNKIGSQICNLSLPNLANTLVFGNPPFSDKIYTLILDAIIKCILSSKRFDEHLF